MPEQPEHAEESADYQRACMSAGGDEVRRIKAWSVQPDMVVWHSGRWLPVMYRRVAGDAVMLDFAVPEPGGTAYRLVRVGVPMYRRITAREGRPASAPQVLELAP